MIELMKEDFTAEKWESYFPSNLESLELAMDSRELPISSFITSLSSLAPRLTTLYVQNIPRALTLPRSLTKLEFGLPPIMAMQSGPVKPDIQHEALLESLPTTLTDLKIHNTLHLGGKETPFRKMPLTIFHANVVFFLQNKEEVNWDILPNTIEDLSAAFSYGENSHDYFLIPTNPSWKQLFPSLTSLKVPFQTITDTPCIKEAMASAEAELSAKQIENIASLFPTSLNSLNIFVRFSIAPSHGIEILIRAIGHRLSKFSFEGSPLPGYVLKWLPRWENPVVKLLQTSLLPRLGGESLAESEQFENFLEKDHPISHLYRGATTLSAGLLTASSISFLPSSITSLDFGLTLQGPISVGAVSEAVRRNENLDPSQPIVVSSYLGSAWKLLGWPKSLTKLNLSLRAPGIPIYLNCLPPTLKELQLHFVLANAEGGDLSHMSQLSSLHVYGVCIPCITSVKGLPRSLRSITVSSDLLTDAVFENEEFKNYFYNLEVLVLLTPRQRSPNVLLYLPSSLTTLNMDTNADRTCWSEKQFESLSRCTKLTFLTLRGKTYWPPTLKFDVFSQYLPKSLQSLTLQIQDWNGKGFEEEIALHIPLSLYYFHSNLSKLVRIVNERRLKLSEAQSGHKE